MRIFKVDSWQGQFNTSETLLRVKFGGQFGEKTSYRIINPEMTHLSFHAFIYSFSHLIIRRLYLPGTQSLKYCFSFICTRICENSQQLCTFSIEDMLRCSGVKWLAAQSLLLKHFGSKFEMIEFATVSSANQLSISVFSHRNWVK